MARALRREAGRSHWARRSAIRPVAPGSAKRKSREGLGKQRCFGGDRVRYTVITNPVTYTGRRRDDETGLFYYRNRYYHAELGRFVTRDPIEYEGGDSNLYGYCADNPLIYTDPNGKAVVTVGVTTFILGRVTYHSILAFCYAGPCADCQVEAGKLIRRAARTLCAKDPIAFQKWLKAAKPGKECAEVCHKAGVHAFKAIVYLGTGVVIKYGIRYVK